MMIRTEQIGEHYDFIVVGSGSAGSVIANRLSEVPNWKILLLEAGAEPNFLTEIPLLVSLLSFTKYNWKYFMEYQPGVATGCKSERMPWPRGRALGGTTVINYMLYTRGNKGSYDKWAAQGNPGWSYEEVLPYFKKSENCHVLNADSEFHGYDGYFRVEDGYQSKITRGFIEGMKELGFPYIDYNSNVSFGVSRIQVNVRNGKRESVSKAFLDPVKNRRNLHVVTYAFVTKLLINDEKRTYGLEFRRFGRNYTVKALKEVILSAGAFVSPQLLMLAGIGPKQHLQDMGIPVLQDLPVGRNLQDHLTYVGLTFWTYRHVSLGFFDVFNPITFLKYGLNSSGPMTSPGGVQAIAYIKTGVDGSQDDIPDIELLFIGGSLATDWGISIRMGMGIKDEIYNEFFAPMETKSSFMVFPLLLTPKSRGHLKLRTTNPFDYPLLYGNYFTDPDETDINTFLAAVRVVQKLEHTEAFKRFGAKFNTIPLPGCTHLEYDSDEYWKCCLRSLMQTMHHQISTVKMGPEDDPEAVVSHELKVYGIEGLRVADSSVMPVSVGAHVSAPCMMIGEKAADLIKDTWKTDL